MYLDVTESSAHRTQKWFFYALGNLLAVSLAGLLLRLFRCFPFRGADYMYLVHAHSHFAFAGWGFLALFIVLTHTFIPEKKLSNNQYRYIFISTEITAWGMLLSFPFQGYATVSIIFSTLYIFVTYWFGYRFLRDFPFDAKGAVSSKFAKAGILFLVVSSIGPFAMAPITAMGKENTPFFSDAIYFYLHFQYNGWFIFGILALFFHWLEKNKIVYRRRPALLFYRLLFYSCIPAYLLSVLWATPPAFIFIVAGMAGITQLASLIPLFLALKGHRPKLSGMLSGNHRILGLFIALLFAGKMLMQAIAAFPPVVHWLNTSRNMVIGYLHLVLLGIITLFLLVFCRESRILNPGRRSERGLWIFFTGFMITEVLLFGNALMNYFHAAVPLFNEWMLYATILLPAGIITMLAEMLSPKDFFARLSSPAKQQRDRERISVYQRISRHYSARI